MMYQYTNAVSADEIIRNYEDVGSERSEDLKWTKSPTNIKFVTGSQIDAPMPEMSEINGHANGHKDQEEGYMCHECVVEAAVKAWQGSKEDAGDLDIEYVAEEIPEDVSICERGTSPSNFDRLVQPTITQRSWFDDSSSVFELEPTGDPLTIDVPTIAIEEEAPDLADDRSSTYTPSIPRLTHVSLMDNPFEQKINIRTLDQYRKALKTFWTATAILLGPDFDLGYDEVLQRVGDQSTDDAPLGVRSTVSWPITPTINVGSTRRNTLGRELLTSLESMGMAWRWFDCESAVQKYMNVRIAPGQTWDFGYCFERKDGTQHCMIMHVVGAAPFEQQKTYKEVVDEPQIAEKFGIVGVAPRFYWCLSHPRSKDRDPKRKARDLRLKQRYEEAKKNLESFKSHDTVPNRFALEASYGNLFLDLEVREKVTGGYSIFTLNTILQLAEITESLGNFQEAEQWNRDLVERRVHRIGIKSEHTCYARFKLAALLIKTSQWDAAKAVTMENLDAVADYDTSHPLYIRQHIQACVIAMRRRRVDAALSVIPYLNLIATQHPDDLVTREIALEVAIEALTFKRKYDQVIIYLPKLIALYANGYGDKQKQLTCSFNLAFTQHRLNNCPEAVRILKECVHFAKGLHLDAKNEQFLDIYFLLGQILFEIKEWNPAKFYLEGAARGYRDLFGREHEKYKKAKNIYIRLEEAMKLKLGLAERLARHHKKQALEARAKNPTRNTPVTEKRTSQFKLLDLISTSKPTEA